MIPITGHASHTTDSVIVQPRAFETKVTFPKATISVSPPPPPVGQMPTEVIAEVYKLTTYVMPLEGDAYVVEIGYHTQEHASLLIGRWW